MKIQLSGRNRITYTVLGATLSLAALLLTAFLGVAAASAAWTAATGTKLSGQAAGGGITLPVILDTETHPIDLPPGVKMDSAFLRADVVVANHSWIDNELQWLPMYAGAALVLAGVLLLRKILQTLPQGDPFTDANARRITALGLLILIGAPARQLLELGVQTYLANQAEYPMVPQAWFDLNPTFPLFAGACLLLLAQVFRHGTKLRADSEGLI